MWQKWNFKSNFLACWNKKFKLLWTSAWSVAFLAKILAIIVAMKSKNNHDTAKKSSVMLWEIKIENNLCFQSKERTKSEPLVRLNIIESRIFLGFLSKKCFRQSGKNCPKLPEKIRDGVLRNFWIWIYF